MSEIKTVTGSVIKIGDTVEVGSKGFTKREIVVDVIDGQYNTEIPVEAHRDNCSLFDSINLGDNVKVSVNLRGSAWKDRHFLSLICWKIDVEGASGQPAGQAQGESFGDTVQRVVDDVTGATVADEDLPF